MSTTQSLSQALDSLNQQQQEAVMHNTGAAVVLAGAGSGKTKVLTTRASRLIEEGLAQPHQILLVTFTNKAAQEMARRVNALSGFQLPFAGTFHRLGARLLREHGESIGLSKQFLIYDSDDQLALVKQVMKQLSIDSSTVKPQSAKYTISDAKNQMISPESYQEKAEGSWQTAIARIYQLYQRELKRLDAVDFDDLLNQTALLLATQADVRHMLQEQFTYVLVDEYQDTNKAQYLLTKTLTQPHDNVFVVGDFSQSIYAWRGADYHNLEKLQQDFDVTEYRLEQNYRSTPTIISAASAVISENTGHPILDLWTETTETSPITVIQAASSEDEARIILQELSNLEPSYGWGDMAILYRTNAQSRPFEEVCVQLGIPYKVVGGFKFYERKEIKDILAYVRWYLNPNDDVSKIRVEKLGKRTAAAFSTWALQDLSEPKTVRTPYDTLQLVIEKSQYLKKLDPKDPQDQARIENITELSQVAAQFDDIWLFLENVALVQDDTMADIIPDEQVQQLTLMSLHAAKGLEFAAVAMVGMEENLLPHSRALTDRNELEEERRLCYVGITRARRKLFMSYAMRRWQYGTAQATLRSRFLSEIPQSLVENKQTPTVKQGSGGYRGSYRSGGFPAGNNNQRDGWKKSWQSPEKLRTINLDEKKNNSGRRLVIDDDELDALLDGDVDIKTFLSR